MNGNKLYRSVSDAKVGGVAAGLGNYFKVDPTIIRLVFILGAIFTGGALALVYLALWLFLPTAASTSSDLGGVVRENMNEMGSRLRGYTSGGSTPPTQVNSTQTNGNPGGTPTTPVGDYQPSQGALPGRKMCRMLPIVLIAVGIFFLLGSFRPMYGGHGWFFPWPLLLIGLGFLVLRGRRYR